MSDWPTANQCRFLEAIKPFPVVYPSGAIPLSSHKGCRTVLFDGAIRLLAITPQGWFALFPLGLALGQKATTVILRLDGKDYPFKDENSLSHYLNQPADTDGRKFSLTFYDNVSISGKF